MTKSAVVLFNPILVGLLVGSSVFDGGEVKIPPTHPNRYSTSSIALDIAPLITWHDFKVIMITSLFCFRQLFSVIKSLILFKILAITVFVSIEQLIPSESITTCLKAVE